VNNKFYTVFDSSILQFPKIHNRAGNITPLQNSIELPFDVKRIYYLYDIPGGESRGAHAHKTLQQLIVAASGSFDVTIDDGRNKKTVHLNRPYYGLHLFPGMWRDLTNFSSGAICLVLASTEYDAADYIREYDDFLRFRNAIL
jgi:hypothetical protein